MSKVIKFKKNLSCPLFLAQPRQYWDEVESKRILLDEVMENAADTLVQREFHPDDFILDRYTMYDYLGSPLWEAYAQERCEGPGFFSFSGPDVFYLQSYLMIDPENAYMAFQFFRLPDYEKGNRAWLFLDQETGTWKKGPGRDFIDLERLLEQR